MENSKNPFLSQVNAWLRKPRMLTPKTYNVATRQEIVYGVPFVSMWFRTRGCKHDHMGECTMCNYGASSTVSATEMIQYVRAGLNSLTITNDMMLLVSPSGSMFDEWEVPRRAREGIFQLVSDTGCASYICETRIEEINGDAIEGFTTILGNKELLIECGLESSNEWILKYCVNKSIDLDRYSEAMSVLNKHNVISISNIMLGNAFLSPAEAIADTVNSVKWALSHGVKRCVVFPAHVKRWTLLEWLWKRGMYSPPSLWSLIEVIHRLGPELASHVTSSWYRSYYDKEFGKSTVVDLKRSRIAELVQDVVLQSPTTCPICRERVMNLLDQYRDTNDFEIIQNLTELECVCKDNWRVLIEDNTAEPISRRVVQAYEQIALDIFGSDWNSDQYSRIVNSIPTYALY